MTNLKVRYIIVIVLLLLTATVIYGLQYDTFSDENIGLADLQVFPMQVGKWHGQDFPLDELVYEILETRAIIHRSFTDKNGENIFLSVVHYHDTKVDFHAPEACIGGRGLKTQKTDKKIQLSVNNKEIILDVAEMITTRESGQTLTYYFFKAGNFLGSNYIKMRLNLALNKLRKNDSSASLIRISTTILPGQEVKAEARLKDFIAALLPLIQSQSKT